MTERTRIECDHCGNDTFVVYYDPKVQGCSIECEACGKVVFL